LDPGNTISQRKKIIRFNQFIFLTLCGTMLSVVSYFTLSLYISALVNLSAGYIFILAFHLNSKKRFELARIIAIVNLNLYLIVMNYMEGLRAGEFILIITFEGVHMAIEFIFFDIGGTLGVLPFTGVPGATSASAAAMAPGGWCWR
jgi:hypothetical protein